MLHHLWIPQRRRCHVGRGMIARRALPLSVSLLSSKSDRDAAAEM